MSLIPTNCSHHLNASRIVLQNDTHLTQVSPSIYAFQQLAPLIIPPLAGALSNWAWSAMPDSTQVKGFSNQIINQVGGFFSRLTTKEKKGQTAPSLALTPSCALGALALSTGQPPLQLAGLGLLTDCIKFPGVKAQSLNTTFLTTAGLSGNNIALSVHPTPDGGFIATGQTSTNQGAGLNDVLLTKFDNNGKVLWTRIIGGPNEDIGRAVVPTQDNGFIVVGETNSFGAGYSDILLAKYLSNGTLSWAKVAGGIGVDSGFDIQQAQDGGFIVTGYTGSYGAGAADLLLVKFTNNGTLSWTKTLGGTSNEIGYSVQQTQDGGFVVTGYTDSYGAGNIDVLLAKFTSTGSLSWMKTIGGIAQDVGSNIQQTVDGGYLITGWTFSYGVGGDDILVTKFDSSGNLLWAKTIGGAGNDAAYSGQETSDGGFLVTGWIEGFGKGSFDIALIKLNATGNLLWAKMLGGAGYDVSYSIKKTLDNGFIISGSTTSFGNNNTVILIAKVDENGHIFNCNTVQFFNPSVTDITSSILITSLSPTVTSPNLVMNNWSTSSIAQTMNQQQLCPKNSTTATMDQSRSFSLSTPHSLSKTLTLPSQSLSPSYLTTLSHSLSLSESPFTKSRSLKKSASFSARQTESASRNRFHTRTRQPTKTRPIRPVSAAIIQQSDLPIAGILHTQLSPSGALVLCETVSGFELVTISREDTMTKTGSFVTTGTGRVSTFSQDEKYVYVANNQGNIQVFDIQDRYNPKSLGIIPTGSSIQSLSVSGDGTQVLVGTATGIQVLSTILPLNKVTFSPTTNPVKAIQTNPNTNTVAIGSGSTLTLLNFINNQFTKLDEKTFASPIKSIAPIDLLNPNRLAITLENRDTIFLNIANPNATSVSSTIAAKSSSEIVAASGATTLIAGVKPGIQIFASTNEVGYSPTNNVSSLEFASDGRFAVLSDDQGLKLIRVAYPSRLDVPLPQLTDIVKLGFPMYEVLVNEANNWIVVGGDRLAFISRDNLQLPTILGTLNTAGNVQKIVFFPDKTKLLFVDNNGITGADCFDASSPRVLGNWNNQKPIRDLKIWGTNAYVCQEDEITILDITNLSNINKIGSITTQGSVQAIQFNQKKSISYVADSSGIQIYQVKTPLLFQPISRVNSTGFVSDLALSADEKSLYFANEQFFGNVNVSDPTMPVLSSRLDTTYPIKKILLSHEGKAAYLAVEINGMLVIDAETMQIKGSLPSTTSSSLAMTEFEDQILLADGPGGLKVAKLVDELPIIPMTARSSYPVGIRVEEQLLFLDNQLTPIHIDRINSIQYIDQGIKRDLPSWISADLVQGKLFVTAPKELTNQPIQLAISFDLNGVRQETIYQTQIVPSLEISTNLGQISISTPSQTVSVDVNLTGGTFIPLSSGPIAASTLDNILQVYGPLSEINRYLQAIRINPSPITLAPSAVALNPVQLRATDIVNLFPTNGIANLRSFRFNQAPVVNHPLNRTNKKALESFEFKVPEDTFIDPDDPKLTLSAQLLNGSALPSWLIFDPMTATFDGFAPASMLNQTLPIKLIASDGYLSVNSTWQLHIDSNQGPFTAKAIPSLTRTTGNEFSYTIPSGIFQDLDNNSLTYSAVQDGYNVLPNFLKFDPETLTFLGRPLAPDDVDTFSIKLTATDKFGASAEAIFDLNIQFSNWDMFLYVLQEGAIATAIASPFTWAYYNRALIRNTIKRKSYWRDEIPKCLLEGKEYKPKHPHSEKEIEKDEILKIHVKAFDKDKCGYKLAESKLPIPLFVSLCATPLLNEEPLPTWLKLDPDTGTLRLEPDHFPMGIQTYVFQVLGKHNFILESFFINPSRISMYQAPVNLTEIITIDEDSDIELSPRPQQIPALSPPVSEIHFEEQGNNRPTALSEGEILNVWAGLDDFQEVLNERPGSEVTKKQTDDEDLSSSKNPRNKWVMPDQTRELTDALSKRPSKTQ